MLNITGSHIAGIAGKMKSELWRIYMRFTEAKSIAPKTVVKIGQQTNKTIDIYFK